MRAFIRCILIPTDVRVRSVFISAAGIPNTYLLLISKLSGVVREDENVDVVYAVLEGYQKILKNIPQVANVVVEETPTAGNTTTNGTIIGGVVKTVITEKVCSLEQPLNYK